MQALEYIQWAPTRYTELSWFKTQREVYHVTEYKKQSLYSFVSQLKYFFNNLVCNCDVNNMTVFMIEVMQNLLLHVYVKQVIIYLV